LIRSGPENNAWTHRSKMTRLAPYCIVCGALPAAGNSDCAGWADAARTRTPCFFSSKPARQCRYRSRGDRGAAIMRIWLFDNFPVDGPHFFETTALMMKRNAAHVIIYCDTVGLATARRIRSANSRRAAGRKPFAWKSPRRR